jgi:hypothetical protein
MSKSARTSFGRPFATGILNHEFAGGGQAPRRVAARSSAKRLRYVVVDALCRSAAVHSDVAKSKEGRRKACFLKASRCKQRLWNYKFCFGR